MTVNNNRVFGITGASGSGKSYISDIFRTLGVTVFDADKIGHEVCSPGGSAYAELFAHFGSEYFLPSGSLDRKKLAKTVFSDKKELDILNKITHKHIRDEIVSRLLKTSGPAAIDGAVIIGSCVEALCSFLVFVDAPDRVRLERIMKRDNISKDDAARRINSQPERSFYKSHCKYTIENDGAKDEKLLLAAENILCENSMLGDFKA